VAPGEYRKVEWRPAIPPDGVDGSSRSEQRRYAVRGAAPGSKVKCSGALWITRIHSSAKAQQQFDAIDLAQCRRDHELCLWLPVHFAAAFQQKLDCPNGAVHQGNAQWRKAIRIYHVAVRPSGYQRLETPRVATASGKVQRRLPV
jgi:hypothetical protein